MALNHFDPISLRVFIAICEEKSFGEAAYRESLTTSAVSKRLASLEEQIGTRLLLRNRRGIKLTAAGEAMLPAARALLQAMAHVQAQISNYANEARGVVRVAATVSAIATSLGKDIAAFYQNHGNAVRVMVEERASLDVVNAVKEGSADLGIFWSDALSTSTLQTFPYVMERLVVVAHKEHPLARLRRIGFAESLPYDQVGIKGGSFLQQTLQKEAFNASMALRNPFIVGNFDGACRIVASNLAVAVVPEESSRPLIKALGLKVIELNDEWAVRRLAICVRDRQMLEASARLLLDALSNQWTRRDGRG